MAEEFKNDMQGAAQSSKETAQNTREIKDNLKDMSMSAADLRTSLTDSLQELTNQKQVLNDTRKGFRSIRDIASKLTLNQEGLNKLSAKELKSLKEKANESTELLKSVTEITAQTAQEKQFQQEAIGFLKDKDGLAKEFSDELDRQIAQQEKIEDLTGTTGALLKGITKIPIVGQLVDSQKALEAAEEAAKETGSRVKTMSAGLKSAGGSIGKNLIDPLSIGAAIATGIVNTFKQLDGLSSSTARNFGISNNEAIGINSELRQAGEATGDAFNNVISLNKALNSVSNQFGTVVDASSELVTDFNELNKKAGISEGALGGIRNLTELTGKSLKETTAEFKGQVALQKAKTGSTLNEAQVLEEIQNTSSAITVSLGGSASAIADAIFKAKSLGVELKDLENISESLLNFQSSIEDELSAELLTGKQLNLEGARYAALMNDQATLAEELAKNIGTAADFQAMNNIEQQAYAKAVGMSREQLADTLIKREALSKLDAKGNTLQERYNNLLKQGNTEEQIAAQLGDEALARQLAGTSVSEKMAASMDMFKSALLPIAETIMPAISRALEYLTNNMGTVVTIGKALAAVMAGMAASAMVAMAVLNPVGFGIGLAAGLAGIAAMSSATKIGDGDFPARGKAMISTKEGGLFQPSINDDIVVAPGASQALRQGGTQKVENKVSIAPSDTNITLNLNGAAIGNANARQNYGVGKNVKALGGNVDYSASI